MISPSLAQRGLLSQLLCEREGWGEREIKSKGSYFCCFLSIYLSQTHRHISGPISAHILKYTIVMKLSRYHPPTKYIFHFYAL